MLFSLFAGIVDRFDFHLQAHWFPNLLYLLSQFVNAESFRELIENAYPSRQGYEAHVHELAVVEADIDRVIIKKMGHNEKLKEKLQLEARQVEIGRKKIMENIF